MDKSYVFKCKVSEAFMDSLQVMKTTFWKISASKDSTPLKELPSQKRNWELASDIKLEQLILHESNGQSNNRMSEMGELSKGKFTLE